MSKPKTTETPTQSEQPEEWLDTFEAGQRTAAANALRTEKHTYDPLVARARERLAVTLEVKAQNHATLQRCERIAALAKAQADPTLVGLTERLDNKLNPLNRYLNHDPGEMQRLIEGIEQADSPEALRVAGEEITVCLGNQGGPVRPGLDADLQRVEDAAAAVERRLKVLGPAPTASAPAVLPYAPQFTEVDLTRPAPAPERPWSPFDFSKGDTR
jgi:DNA integrity scanning protein DisA with diadenylate cyclase activity